MEFDNNSTWFVIWFILLQESIEEEVRDIAEAFTTSARASASFVDSDLVDLDEDDEDDKNKDLILDDKPDDSVKLVSVSKLGSKESISDKDRLKAGIMTTNKKVGEKSGLCLMWN